MHTIIPNSIQSNRLYAYNHIQFNCSNRMSAYNHTQFDLQQNLCMNCTHMLDVVILTGLEEFGVCL
jgi:hypothetical protein